MVGKLRYHYITMQRIMLTVSDNEHETLRRLSFERRVPMAQLVRDAIDAAYGTEQSEVGPPGRRPRGDEK